MWIHPKIRSPWSPNLTRVFFRFEFKDVIRANVAPYIFAVANCTTLVMTAFFILKFCAHFDTKLHRARQLEKQTSCGTKCCSVFTRFLSDIGIYSFFVRILFFACIPATAIVWYITFPLVTYRSSLNRSAATPFVPQYAVGVNGQCFRTVVCMHLLPFTDRLVFSLIFQLDGVVMSLLHSSSYWGAGTWIFLIVIDFHGCFWSQSVRSWYSFFVIVCIVTTCAVQFYW